MAIKSVIDNPCPCPKCGHGWKRGELIAKTDKGVWAHEHCVAGPAAKEAEKPAPKPPGKPRSKPVPPAAPAAPAASRIEFPAVEVRCGMAALDKALAYLSVGANVMLVGPKGCGKTTMAQNMADSLGLRFGFIALSGGVGETAIFGTRDRDNRFRQTSFVDIYEQGGLWLFDEVDAADSNVLLSLNSALANGIIPLPYRYEKPIARRHPHFVCVAAANTHGNGASRQYAGRNVLDGAFVARFRSVTMDYDRKLEMRLCPDTELRQLMWKFRENAQKAKLERVISTRELQWAWTLKSELKADLAFIIESLSDGWKDEERRLVFG